MYYSIFKQSNVLKWTKRNIILSLHNITITDSINFRTEMSKKRFNPILTVNHQNQHNPIVTATVHMFVTSCPQNSGTVLIAIIKR